VQVIGDLVRVERRQPYVSGHRIEQKRRDDGTLFARALPLHFALEQHA
jgi:hypothetical protein